MNNNKQNKKDLEVLKQILPIPSGYELKGVRNNTMLLKKVEDE